MHHTTGAFENQYPDGRRKIRAVQPASSPASHRSGKTARQRRQAAGHEPHSSPAVGAAASTLGGELPHGEDPRARPVSKGKGGDAGGSGGAQVAVATPLLPRGDASAEGPGRSWAPRPHEGDEKATSRKAQHHPDGVCAHLRATSSSGRCPAPLHTPPPAAPTSQDDRAGHGAPAATLGSLCPSVPAVTASGSHFLCRRPDL